MFFSEKIEKACLVSSLKTPIVFREKEYCNLLSFRMQFSLSLEANRSRHFNLDLQLWLKNLQKKGHTNWILAKCITIAKWWSRSVCTHHHFSWTYLLSFNSLLILHSFHGHFTLIPPRFTPVCPAVMPRYHEGSTFSPWIRRLGSWSSTWIIWGTPMTTKRTPPYANVQTGLERFFMKF